MFLRGLGIKAAGIKALTKLVKALFPVGSVYTAPKRAVTSTSWIQEHSKSGGRIIPIYPSHRRRETAPVIVNHTVSGRFEKYYNREVPGACLVEIPGGVIYGTETNFIITPDFLLLADVSREFGRYGGRLMKDSSLITQQLHLPSSPVFVNGKVAVLSTCGARNFHHWNYDIMPRVQLLKEAGVFDSIDRFIIAHSALPFQLEALQRVGVPSEKVFNPLKEGTAMIKTEVLLVPSLPSPLGTVSPWVVDFLRKTYNPSDERSSLYKRIYLSRKRVTTRKIINNDGFVQLLNEFSIIEIFPEDYSVSALARILAGADLIISVHGSGLSNLCFISEKTIVIDILAPYHQDGYYWMISNIRNATYIGFFGEGTHPADDVDLVANKIDDDIELNIERLRELFISKLQ